MLISRLVGWVPSSPWYVSLSDSGILSVKRVKDPNRLRCRTVKHIHKYKSCSYFYWCFPLMALSSSLVLLPAIPNRIDAISDDLAFCSCWPTIKISWLVRLITWPTSIVCNGKKEPDSPITLFMHPFLSQSIVDSDRMVSTLRRGAQQVLGREMLWSSDKAKVRGFEFYIYRSRPITGWISTCAWNGRESIPI